MSEDVSIEKEHPLALELHSLRKAVEHFQLEAHKSNLQLQHLSLQNKEVTQKWHARERENEALVREINVFRETASSLTASHRDALQVQELTLSLRRLSDKLDLADEELLKRNEDVAAAQAEREAARRLEVAAHEHLESLRMQLEQSHLEKQDIMARLRAEEQQRKMSDLVVEEYANLVRKLEGRKTVERDTSRSSIDGLQNARNGLDKLLRDSNADSEKLHAEITQLHEALDKAQMQLAAERGVISALNKEIAEGRLALQKLERDDRAAAKMVSRYMKFSQSSTNILHDAIASLKSRQAASIASYETRLEEATCASANDRRHYEQLLRSFEELTEDISRESYGRRREVILRLSLLTREETLSERLRRWILRTKEVGDGSEMHPNMAKILVEADSILKALDEESRDDGSFSGALARVISAESSARSLREELQRETDLRLYYQRQLHLDLRRRRQNPLTPKWDSKLRLAEMSGTSLPLERKLAQEPMKAAQESTNLNSYVITDDKFSFVRTPPSHANPSPAGFTTTDIQAEATSGPSVAGSEVTDTGLPSDALSPSISIVELPSLDDAKNPTATVSIIGVKGANEQDTHVTSATNDEENEEAPKFVTELDLALNSPPRSTESISEHFTPKSDPVPIVEHQHKSSSVMEQEDRMKIGELELPSEISAPLLIVGGIDDDQIEAPSERFANLLQRLSTAHGRYASMQKAFRDCNIALQQMKTSASESMKLPKDALLLIIERLSDHCEDARVELEIRSADEERIAKGYETLLAIPDALSDDLNEPDLCKQVEAFIDGSDPTVSRAEESLRHKRDDLEHDIAVVKVAMSETSPLLPTSEIPGERPRQSGWSAWTGSILAPSRAASPAPSFGAVMTSPRLRHTSSSSSLRHESSSASPIASLGLRIPMPSMPSDMPRRNDNPTSLFMQRGGPRPHVSSNVLGLGFKGGLIPNARMPSNISFDSLHHTTPGPPAIDSDDVE